MMKADRNSNCVLHCDNPSMESTLPATMWHEVNGICRLIPYPVKKNNIRSYQTLSLLHKKRIFVFNKDNNG